MVAPRTNELFNPGNDPNWLQWVDLSGITRVNIIDHLGNNTEYRNIVVDLLLQDDGRTLKVLIFE